MSVIQSIMPIFLAFYLQKAQYNTFCWQFLCWKRKELKFNVSCEYMSFKSHYTVS